MLYAEPLLAQCIRHKLILKNDSVPEKVAGGFLFTEGPTSDRKGNIYFTDQPDNKILSWNNRMGVTVFLTPAGRSNGMMFDRSGNLWTCADEKNQLWKISPGKKTDVIITSFNGSRLNGPNDVWISPVGGIYFTDPFYKRDWWDHDIMPQEKECVYYFSPVSGLLSRVADDLVKPNGITGSADGKILYVADIGANKTWRYQVNPDGTLTGKELFCPMGSDGMTTDTEGNIYLTGNGVTIFSSSGIQIAHIPVPENWTSNVCFGDKDFHTLYITAGGALYRIRLGVRGVRG